MRTNPPIRISFLLKSFSDADTCKYVLTLVVNSEGEDNFEDFEGEIYEDDDQQDEEGAGEDLAALEKDGNNIVPSGDPSAAAAAKSDNTVKNIKDKKVPNDKRTTTPYMTKYERARVLGTRALQIRWVSDRKHIVVWMRTRG